MSTHVQEQIAALLAQAEQRADARDWAGAAMLCAQACELAPASQIALDKLGWFLSRAKQYQQAAGIYEQLVAQQPNWARWPYMLGYQYYDRQQWREAIQWFDRALEVRPDYLVVLYRKGYAHTRLNEDDRARQAFERCITAWRSLEGEERNREAKYYAGACFQLGKILLGLGQSRRAEYLFSEAVQYSPPDPYKHYNLGKALLKNGKLDDALMQFEHAAALKPGDDNITLFTARACTACGDYQRAEEMLNRIPLRRRKSHIWAEIGRVYLLRDEPQKALDALMMAVRMDTGNHNYQYQLGQANEACGDITAAYRAYAQATALRQQHYNLAFPAAQERMVAIEQLAEESRISLSDTGTMNLAPDGAIKAFNMAKGFGFIARPMASDLFFHITDVINPDQIVVGASTTFAVIESNKGLRAIQVTVV